MDSEFDLRLIQTFSGDKDDLTISEWLENVEMVCRLTNVAKLECVLALRLKGRAFKVYHQLSMEDKKDANKIKQALKKVFGTDPFVAYNQFVGRTLQSGEAPEEFLADLFRLARSVGPEPPKEWITCAFISGLPQRAQELLRASSRMDTLPFDDIVSRARAILMDDGEAVGLELAAVTQQPREVIQPAKQENCVVCHKCSGVNHMAKDCLLGRQPVKRERVRRLRNSMRCFRCNQPGHFVAECPEKNAEDRTGASVLPLKSM